MDDGVGLCQPCSTADKPGQDFCTPAEQPKTPEDCSATQYLNDSDTDQTKHTCQACPLGAFCHNRTARCGRRWRNVDLSFEGVTAPGAHGWVCENVHGTSKGGNLPLADECFSSTR